MLATPNALREGTWGGTLMPGQTQEQDPSCAVAELQLNFICIGN